MEKTHTDAITQANIEPSIQEQDAALRNKTVKSASLVRRRRVAWFAIAGIAIGAPFAYFNDNPLTLGILWGGVSASALGWLVTGRVKP